MGIHRTVDTTFFIELEGGVGVNKCLKVFLHNSRPSETEIPKFYFKNDLLNFQVYIHNIS